MSNKETTLKEKFKLALTSTAKVISDDFELNSKSSDKKKQKEINTIEIEDLNNPSDFMRLRAETDSAALKKNFLMRLFIEKIYPLIVRQDHFII
jgi:cobaltochelatase CobT